MRASAAQIRAAISLVRQLQLDPESQAAIELLATLAEKDLAPQPVTTDAGRLALEALREGRPVDERDLLALYQFARTLGFASTDAEADRTRSRSQLELIKLCRKEFAADATQCAFYLVRAIRFWRDRAAEQRWPGPGVPDLRRICDDRLLTAYRKGEFGDPEQARHDTDIRMNS